MESRRDFLKKAALLAACGGAVPEAVQKAFAIDPASGSTYLDAEHVVILMQENRSFDHTYGTLRGVRGFNDPRAQILPNGNPVWLQDNAQGETFAPFRFDMKNTKVTWMGSLPHGWVDQQGARNGGLQDGWVPAKAASNPKYRSMPLTMGYYTRDDIPFYYALADAFTVCDQNFCSSLTATEPNRLHLWTGTVREKPSIDSFAHVRNEDIGYDSDLQWTTFPDRLEERGISWRVYQNEISLNPGLSEEANAWLSSFDDNPLEYFTQYQVRFANSYRRSLVEKEGKLSAQLDQLTASNTQSDEATRKQIETLTEERKKVRYEQATLTDQAFASLPRHQQNLHLKAFTTNQGDPDYRELTELSYHSSGMERTMKIPKGDVLHQFRQDVRSGKLPMVSWIVPPERFSDHPSSPWYGAWYLSETLDILTENSEVWKKTIFILCYDENDGYYDHVPPFVPPHPHREGTGKVSPDIDTAVEYVTAEQHAQIQRKDPEWTGQEGPIGLGFRVPLVIASPWSRGGYVCSQVFDHTSILQFLEVFLTHKIGSPVRESNISGWRRAVCGDLTSVFRPYSGKQYKLPEAVERDRFLSSIYEAQFKDVPGDFKSLTPEEIARARKQTSTCSWMPRQEAGTRPACGLPYDLAVDGCLRADAASFAIDFSAATDGFGKRSAGAPFRVYAPGKVRGESSGAIWRQGRVWDYAVTAGSRLGDEWPLTLFDQAGYHLCVYGPNGFYREFRGSAVDPRIRVSLRPARYGSRTSGDALLEISNEDPTRPVTVHVEDASYGTPARTVRLGSMGQSDANVTLTLPLVSSFGWYDLRISVEGKMLFEQRYAGHIETGSESTSDPLMA
jgi:phospholipase C